MYPNLASMLCADESTGELIRAVSTNRARYGQGAG